MSDLNTIVQQYMTRKRPQRSVPARPSVVLEAARPQLLAATSAPAAFLFGSPYACEPCKWGVEELPMPWSDGAGRCKPSRIVGGSAKEASAFLMARPVKRRGQAGSYVWEGDRR
jgi:hypothetical protein